MAWRKYIWGKVNGSVAENTFFHASQHSNCMDSYLVEFFKALRIYFLLPVPLQVFKDSTPTNLKEKKRSTKLSWIAEFLNQMFILACKSWCYLKNWVDCNCKCICYVCTTWYIVCLHKSLVFILTCEKSWCCTYLFAFSMTE